MAEVMQFIIGSETGCSDGECGEVTRVVVDPTNRSVTHIVVEPRHHKGRGRLVPLDLVEVSAPVTRLSCTKEEFENLPVAEETQFLPLDDDYEQYTYGQVLYRPLYVQNANAGGLGGRDARVPIITDLDPEGEYSIRRGDRVHATDGEIGKIQGLVIDRESRRVTHVLLQEGHLWERKEVAIPVSAFDAIENGVYLNITKRDIEALPEIAIDHSVA